jgi:hypothetical protein
MPEAPLRLDGSSDHDEGGAYVIGGFGDGTSQLAGPCAHDLAVRADPVTLGKRPLAAELDTEHPLLAVEMSIERKLPVDEERRQQENARATIGGEPAGQVKRMPVVLLVEQRDDDHSVSAGETASCSPETTMAPSEPVSGQEPAEGCHATKGRSTYVNATSRSCRPASRCSQDGRTNRYPAPGSVKRKRGRAGSGSIFRRSCET